MSEMITDLIAAADGVRLDQSQYQHDFDVNLWRADGTDSWKLERMQNFSEVGFPSWEALMAGDWDRALRLYEEERPSISRFHERFRRHHSDFYRVRVVIEPVTPYVQWEMYCLKLRAEYGEKIRVVNFPSVSPYESTGILPELVSVCGLVMYRTIYDEDQKPDGAIRYSDPGLVAQYERFARQLYEMGEDIKCYFQREIAKLPPPLL